MSHLPPLRCPRCKHRISAVECTGKTPVVKSFADCLRRCEPCGVGASNSVNRPTWVYRDPLENIPMQSREGVNDALNLALNQRSRKSKRVRFGFSTSEDAVTWVVFTHLLRSGRLSEALKRAGVISTRQTLTNTPTLLLWCSPIDNCARGLEIRERLEKLCVSLGERSDSFSEPDVIIDFGEGGVVFIEVKYRSKNDYKLPECRGWKTYDTPRSCWQFEDMKASGCYELARNWCLLKNLAGETPSTLVNLGSADLFRGKEGARLDRFASALGTDERSHFVRVTWSELFGNDMSGMPEWFIGFCHDRNLTA